jgi:hypothetical protein
VQNDGPTHPTNDVYLAKFASDGELLWTDILPHPQFGFASLTNDIQPTMSGGFVATGVAYLPDSTEGDIFLASIDAEGNVEWARRFAMPGLESGNDVKALKDGGFVIAGTDHDLPDDRFGCQVIRTDANAEVLWARNFVPEDPLASADCSVIEPTKDGGFILLGQAIPVGSVLVYAFAVRLDADGNVRWSREYDSLETVFRFQYLYMTDVREMQDGDFLFIGEGRIGGSPPLFVFKLQTTSKGTVRWDWYTPYPYPIPNLSSVPQWYPSILQIDARGLLIGAGNLVQRFSYGDQTVYVNNPLARSWYEFYPDDFSGGPGIPVSDGKFFVLSNPAHPEATLVDLCAMKIDITQ